MRWWDALFNYRHIMKTHKPTAFIFSTIMNRITCRTLSIINFNIDDEFSLISRLFIINILLNIAGRDSEGTSGTSDQPIAPTSVSPLSIEPIKPQSYATWCTKRSHKLTSWKERLQNGIYIFNIFVSCFCCIWIMSLAEQLPAIWVEPVTLRYHIPRT